MYTSELIFKYFENLSEQQRAQFTALYDLYGEWNAKINVVSRKDFSSLYLHHVLHSLAIAKVCNFADGARVIDVGCGGGFPSLPLAILFPNVNFTAVDSIGKKITVVENVRSALGPTNLRAINDRVERVEGKFDFVVSRAVTDMSTFVGWVWRKIERGQGHGTLPNGILYLKGGDLTEELAATGKEWTIFNISDFFEEEFFETKQVVYTTK
ncbi:MAG: 16S rRNA (guanine(527)-N(7))-methyltransferase RsmG [Alistipes sp.]|nr:16S rRNA (guanine(527)-N(7))-methyltransferase RsmG [Alistipes sp.]